MNKKQFLTYDEYSDTIRQEPENYKIAHRENNRWICEPDMAANKELATKIFTALFDYNIKYGTGTNLIENLK